MSGDIIVQPVRLNLRLWSHYHRHNDHHDTYAFQATPRKRLSRRRIDVKTVARAAQQPIRSSLRPDVSKCGTVEARDIQNTTVLSDQSDHSLTCCLVRQGFSHPNRLRHLRVTSRTLSRFNINSTAVFVHSEGLLTFSPSHCHRTDSLTGPDHPGRVDFSDGRQGFAGPRISVLSVAPISQALTRDQCPTTAS